MAATLTDRAVDEEMANDWKDIVSRHSLEDDVAAPDKGGKVTESEGEGDAAPQGQSAEGSEGAGDKKGAAPDKEAAADQPRDKSGRYKPAPKAPKGREAAPAARAEDAQGERGTQARQAQQPQEGEQQTQQPGEAPRQRDLTRAPSTWSPKERAAWANVPQEARAAIHRREADFMSGQSQLLPDAQLGQELRGVIDPYRMLIESEGGTPVAAVQDLLRTAAVLRTGTFDQKHQVAANILNRYGIDPRLLVPRQPGQPMPQQQAPQQQFRDPRVDQLLHNMQTEQQQRFAVEQRDTQSLVVRWMNETDRQGNPVRPYVNDVIDAMSAMIPQLKAGDPTLTHAQALERAYEAAIWANPEIRQLLQTQQRTANDAQRRADSQRRAGEARRAASVNVPRRAGVPRRSPTGSMEDTIAETARELGLIQS